MGIRVLVVEDKESFLELITTFLKRGGHEPIVARTADEALRVVSALGCDAALIDFMLPGELTGSDLGRAMKALCPDTALFMLTGYSTARRAEQWLTDDGFTDVIDKTDVAEQWEATIGSALKQVAERREHRATAQSEPRILRSAGKPGVGAFFVGVDDRMGRAVDDAARAALGETCVLVTGESGVGKGLLAQAIHALSPRRHGPFVKVPIPGVAESILEREIFGNVKGAYTDADVDRQGLIDAAEGGTMFLDEIGDAPPRVQAKLLELVEEHTFRPVGANRSRMADVRFVVATNRDLEAAVEKGDFRRDLFERIKTPRIELPPLKERSQDIVALADFLASELGDLVGRTLRIDKAVHEAFVAYQWPGNVREMRNCIKWMAEKTEGNQLTFGLLPPDLRSALKQPEGPAEEEPQVALRWPPELLKTVERITLLENGLGVGKTLGRIATEVFPLRKNAVVQLSKLPTQVEFAKVLKARSEQEIRRLWPRVVEYLIHDRTDVVLHHGFPDWLVHAADYARARSSS